MNLYSAVTSTERTQVEIDLSEGNGQGAMNATHASNEDHDMPKQYEIRLKGHLDARWADWFAGLSFIHASDGTTMLAGPVVDQAALYGLLRKVGDLGLPLLLVMEVESKPASGPDGKANTDHNHLQTETTI